MPDGLALGRLRGLLLLVLVLLLLLFGAALGRAAHRSFAVLISPATHPKKNDPSPLVVELMKLRGFFFLFFSRGGTL